MGRPMTTPRAVDRPGTWTRIKTVKPGRLSEIKTGSGSTTRHRLPEGPAGPPGNARETGHNLPN